MDISRYNFSWNLLEILTSVSESHFVSIDLELSGIPVRLRGARESGKQTLQQRYEEIRAAADKYTILQIGLTCVREDAVEGRYELKPFNINLSPVLDEGMLDVDRDFSFHSGAVEFLNSVGFNFQAPLAIGVPYMSVEEAALAKERARERHSRTKDFYDPLVIKAEETETLRFKETVVSLVKAWQTAGEPDESLYLGPKDLSTIRPSPEELSRFEKRLVHQIIRFEFDGLVTIPRRGMIQVIRLDQEREDAVKRQKLKDTDARIARQTGFRWVVEAIAGRSLRAIDWRSFIQLTKDGAVIQATEDTKSRFERAKHLLEGKPRPLVGHNMLLDLVYLYRTFIGKLPETIVGFASSITDLFPFILDTKYLATHECGDINPMSSLQQLAAQLSQRERPVMQTNAAFDKYDDLVAHHEAGYDSFLTAQIAIRLSSKLEAERIEAKTKIDGATIQDDGRVDDSSEDDAVGGVSVTQSDIQHRLSSDLQANEVTVTTPVQAPAPVVKPQSTALSSRFAHRTAFERLGEENEGPNDSDADRDEDVLEFDDLPGQEKDAHAAEQGSDWQGGQSWQPCRLMPRWHSEFWSEYGNRLRVFGTQESLCILPYKAATSAKKPSLTPVQW